MPTSLPGPFIELRDLIERYLAVSGGYGKEATLSSLGLSRSAVESTFSLLDEDYLISRYLHFRNSSGERFQINGFPQTHVAMDAAIRSVL